MNFLGLDSRVLVCKRVLNIDLDRIEEDENERKGGTMSKQFKVYGDVVQDYYIVVTANSRDEAWYAAEATPKEDWKKLPDRNEGNAIEPYNIEELD